MDVVEWVESAIVIVIGAYILYVLIQSFTETYPAFGQYGWGLLGAYVAGAVLFLKYSLSKS
ncbi:MAG: hypothetical protein QXZ70_00485 [Candidatus Bathyarchaeia archaeon]